MRFKTEQELADYSSSMNPFYSEYAAQLWAAGLRSAQELVDSSIEDLYAAGVTSRFAARTIKATAGAATGAAAGASSGSTPSTTPPEQKRVKIHTASSYGDEYVTFNVHFKDAEDLKEYLFCAQVPGLLEVAEDAIPTLIRKFEELVDGGDYTHWPCSKEAFDTVLDEVQHLQQAHEDEFMISRSALHHVQETEYTEPDQEYVLREHLQKLPNSNKQPRVDDVIIVGKSAAWVGSHTTYVKGAKPVRQLAERAKELGKLPNELLSCVKATFMLERADHTYTAVEQKLYAVCQRLQVVRFKRMWGAMTPVYSMAAVGRQQLLRF